jgi:hypothetical protein
LVELDAAYGPRGVRFVGVNSNPQDSLADVRDYVRRCGIGFPFGKDFDQQIVSQFGARRTPEVFVLDKEFVVRYRGRIDDQYQPGIARDKATRHDLREALEQLLSGVAVSVPQTEPAGCLIGRVKKPAADGKVTYCDQVSRVVQQHCMECHRAGEIGPFALTEYEEVMGWAEMMVEVIDQGRMPPWHARPEVGHFANARSMPEADKQLIRDWVAAGTPYGDRHALPTAPEFVSGWRLPRAPDLVLSMSATAYRVPADGIVEYQYFVVDPGFQEDRWVAAAQVLPGNASIVHHSIVFIRPPDGSTFRGVGWLSAYVPGNRATTFPAGHARKIPAGSRLVFQQHYTPNGSPQADVTRVGMVFVPEPEVTHEVLTLVGIDQEFEIPPFAAHHVIEGRVRSLPRHGKLLAIMPHMHLRGKSFELFARVGEERTAILDVPNYDFNWQHSYEMAEPLSLAAVDQLEFRVGFDNSAGNPVNPDPSRHVTWGDQTWEEMAVAFFEVAEPRSGRAGGLPSLAPSPARTSAGTATDRHAAAVESPISPERQTRIDDFLARFFELFDHNRDGRVHRTEVPIAVRDFGFGNFDANGDGWAERDEVTEAATARIRE